MPMTSPDGVPLLHGKLDSCTSSSTAFSSGLLYTVYLPFHFPATCPEFRIPFHVRKCRNTTLQISKGFKHVSEHFSELKSLNSVPVTPRCEAFTQFYFWKTGWKRFTFQKLHAEKVGLIIRILAWGREWRLIAQSHHFLYLVMHTMYFHY